MSRAKPVLAEHGHAIIQFNTRAVRELFASMGVNAREFFWAMGQYDVI